MANERPTARFHSLTDMQFLAAEALVQKIKSGQDSQEVLAGIDDPVVLDLVVEGMTRAIQEQTIDNGE